MTDRLYEAYKKFLGDYPNYKILHVLMDEMMKEIRSIDGHLKRLERYVTSNTISWMLPEDMKRLERHVTSNEEKEAVPVQEWMKFNELCQKYPFMSSGSIHEVLRLAPNGCDYIKYDPTFGKIPLFNPKNFVRHLHKCYIESNGRQYSRLHARLKRQNFFGFIDND